MDSASNKLSGKQRRYLRALGHHLTPIVLVGKNGVTDAAIDAIDVAIVTHELIKVRRSSECPQSRKEMALALSERLGAECVQQLGHTVLLYRAHPDKPTIELPR